MNELAARQAALAAYLTGSGPLPAGFDRDAASAAAGSLDRKRAGEIADAFPELAAALGADFHPLLSAWLPGRPRTTPAEQAGAFALDLARQRDLPVHVLTEVARRAAAVGRWTWRTRIELGHRTAVVTGSPGRIRAVRLR